MLFLVVKVDNHLYSGTPAIFQRFEEFLPGQFHVKIVASKCLDIMRAKLKQHPSRYVKFDAKKKLDDL